MIDRSTDIKAALRSRQRGFLLNPFRFGGGGGGSTDPHWANVSLLVQATSSIFDAGPSSRTIETGGSGGVAISTTVKQFDQNTISFAGSPSGWLMTASSSAFDFGSGDFTVEAFVRPESSSEMGVYSKRASTSNYMPIGMYVRNNRLYLLGSYAGIEWDINNTFANGPTPIPSGGMTHIAVSRVGSTLRGFVGGAVDQTYSVGASALMSNSNKVAIGASAENGSNGFSGFIYGLRVTKGIGRYSSAFTPPTGPFPTTGP